MSILRELRERFRPALASLAEGLPVDEWLDAIRPSQDPRFGDYQANFAMALGKRLGRPPREVAQEVAARLNVSDLCQPPEVAGPGFINLRVRDDVLAARITAAAHDPRLGIAPVAAPRTYVLDYSAPNVAKPMHVGHIRSTVIGDSLCRTLQFLGHRVISDNHLGDWGTQFGMILYGYRHFLDAQAYRSAPVAELSRLYRLVRQLIDYQQDRRALASGELAGKIEQLAAAIAKQKAVKPDKQAAKALAKLESDRAEACKELDALREKVAAVEHSPQLAGLVQEHAQIEAAVLAETAKLHAGDQENRRLWREVLKHSMVEIQRVYDRLGVRFDHTLGESFYHDRLGPLVGELLAQGIARESDGAICVFLEGIEEPMIVRKKDGAFLYATTDLATLRYRRETWRPDAILYVVDHRQKLHFEQLFAAARKIGLEGIELQHVMFGTVLGDDKRPFKTRSGDTVGLDGLLDEAVRRAGEVVSANDDSKPDGPELSSDQRRQIAEVVGIGALKYADLSQNRTSDYVFSYDKMLAMNGNTATYMQYAYTRVRGIFRRASIDADAVRQSGCPVLLTTPAERALAVQLLRFGEALDLAAAGYLPNQLTSYLFDLANQYTTFYEKSPVLKAESPELRDSRLALCDLTARTIRQGLELLGIGVVEKM